MKIINIFQIVKGKDFLDRLLELGDLSITILSEDFNEKVNKFEWEQDEREEFIKDMLALNPKKREEILIRMIKVL
jgi:hypothetical protein